MRKKKKGNGKLRRVVGRVILLCGATAALGVAGGVAGGGCSGKTRKVVEKAVEKAADKYSGAAAVRQGRAAEKQLHLLDKQYKQKMDAAFKKEAAEDEK